MLTSKTSKAYSKSGKSRKEKSSLWLDKFNKEKAELLGHLLNRLLLSIERERNQEPHPGLIIARHDFFEPYPTCSQIDLLLLSNMQLKIKFAYPALSGYAKFTVVLTRKLSSGAKVTFMIGLAIRFIDSDGKVLPKSEAHDQICKYISEVAEKYDGAMIWCLSIVFYMDGKKNGNVDWEKGERTLL